MEERPKMNMKNDDPFIELRKQAEKILKGHKMEEVDYPDFSELIHDLEVHHVELELQNEELRRTQKELEASRNEYHALFNSAPVGFAVIGAKGVISRINRAAEEMLAGPEDNTLNGMAFVSLVYPEDRHLYSSLLRSLGRHHKGVTELRMRGSRGLIYVRIEATAKMDEEGVFSSWHFAISDITKHKEGERALKRAKDELEVRVRERTAELELKNKELQDFAFVASHDLSEPLRKIQTFERMVTERCEGGSFDEVSRDYLRRMEKAAARMQNLLNSLLLYSRVTTKAEPKKETDLRKSIEAALSNLEVLIGEKNARVEVGELPTIRADRIQMIQLFQNLIGNALKFNRDGEAPHVKIHAEEAGNAYKISVEDNGIGFDEKYVDKIFLPFQRLHGRSSEYEGVGMGLAICKKIVEGHGGIISARSEPGKGSTFIVTLPAIKKVR
jgi:PAS domain S-box-containing protein